MAGVQFTVSAMLPTTGGLMDVLTANGQTYIRDIQKKSWFPEQLLSQDTGGTTAWLAKR